MSKLNRLTMTHDEAAWLRDLLDGRVSAHHWDDRTVAHLSGDAREHDRHMAVTLLERTREQLSDSWQPGRQRR